MAIQAIVVKEVVENDGEFIHIRYIELENTEKPLRIWISDEKQNSQLRLSLLGLEQNFR